MDWNECNFKKLVKNIKKDTELIKSLSESSYNKLTSEELLTLNETTCSSKISLAYDSLRELLEALALEQGYKIYNHECYTPFLKEILKEVFLSDEFDEIRKIRNQVNYYAKKINIEETNDIILKIKELRNNLINKYPTLNFSSDQNGPIRKLIGILTKEEADELKKNIKNIK